MRLTSYHPPPAPRSKPVAGGDRAVRGGGRRPRHGAGGDSSAGAGRPVRAEEGRPRLHRSATPWPTGCSTTAGSRRYLHSRFPEHDLVVRNLGFSGDELTTPAPLGRLRHARRVADRDQGRRRLRLLRLQRVVRRRGGPAEVQGRPRRVHQAHARPEVQRQARARGSSCSRRSPTRTCTTATCPTARRTTSGSSSTPTAMAEVAKANERPVRRPVPPDAGALRQGRASR